MAYCFLQEDFDRLRERVANLTERIREVGEEMGEACQQSAETYHDNFPYEESLRQYELLSRRLAEFLEILRNAEVVTPPKQSHHVAVGCKVTVLDLDTDEVKTFRIGSYLILDGNDAISYRAPLARLLIGAEEGDVREGVIGGRVRSFEILAIE